MRCGVLCGGSCCLPGRSSCLPCCGCLFSIGHLFRISDMTLICIIFSVCNCAIVALCTGSIGRFFASTVAIARCDVRRIKCITTSVYMMVYVLCHFSLRSWIQ